MSTERVHWIDIARGIGIVFIIYAHVLGIQGIRYLFYSFHIPLFFFLSGVVYNHKKYINFPTFFKKSAKGLLIPYFTLAFVFFVLWIIRTNLNHPVSPETIKQFISIFYGNSNNGLMAFNDVLWFLPALFVTRILFASLHGIIKKTKPLILVLFFFSIFGYLFSLYFAKIKLPFGAETAFSAVVFYGAGFLWNQSEKAKSLISKYKYYLFLPLLAIGVYIATIEYHAYGHQIDMRLNHLNNYFSFYFDAFCGVIAWVSFSMIVNKNYLLEKFGKNSLVLFAWHPFLFTYFGIILAASVSKNIIESVLPYLPLIYTILAMTIILVVSSLYNRITLPLRRTAK
jgi:acyltransferase